MNNASKTFETSCIYFSTCVCITISSMAMEYIGLLQYHTRYHIHYFHNPQDTCSSIEVGMHHLVLKYKAYKSIQGVTASYKVK